MFGIEWVYARTKILSDPSPVPDITISFGSTSSASKHLCISIFTCKHLFHLVARFAVDRTQAFFVSRTGQLVRFN